MKPDQITRRTFFRDGGLLAAAAASGTLIPAALARESKLHISSNSYSWNVYFAREQRNFDASLDAGFAELKESGVDGYEPGITDPKQIDDLIPLLRKHKVEMRSIYCSSSLHEEAEAAKSVDNILRIAQKAQTVGTRIIVTNPNPIRWAGPENKTDAQLITQANFMNTLGRRLSHLGIQLAYHNHDIELRNAGREFHHMMVGTDPRYVTLCLDAHWVYRGSGNSSVALFDVVKLYGRRVSELHFRQSTNQVWSETFGPGDIDYSALVKQLVANQVKPHLVLEQACEAGTPSTLKAVEVFRRSATFARAIFTPFA
jgi:inosose dehydratase